MWGGGGGFPFALFCNNDFANDLALLKKHLNRHQVNAHSLQSSSFVMFTTTLATAGDICCYSSTHLKFTSVVRHWARGTAAQPWDTQLFFWGPWHSTRCSAKKEEGRCVKLKPTNHRGPLQSLNGRRLWKLLSMCVDFQAQSELWASHLTQQTLQLPLQVAVLTLERLVLGQGELQTRF